MDSDFDQLRYPIGPWKRPMHPTSKDREAWIGTIAGAPEILRAAVHGLTDKQLDTPYRPGGWTVRQLVHHVADSHINAYCRLRLAMTEENPTIRPYDEAAWAELSDGRSEPIELSLRLLEPLHARWTALARTLSGEDFSRTVQHPEMGELRVDDLLSMYAWHSAHHTTHVTNLREREGW